jgi:GT2 family glycosyltransferase
MHSSPRPLKRCAITRLATIIVNYRTPNLVVDCLRSLVPEVTELGPIFVVDNGSGDDSVQQLNAAVVNNDWTKSVQLLPLSTNAGYSAGNNAGIRIAQQLQPTPDYFLLLNPDTVVRPGAATELLNFMQSHPQVGIAGSRLEDPDATPQRSAFRFPSLLGELEGGLRLGFVTRMLQRFVVAPPVRNEAHVADWVAGASMIIRREVIEQIGLMDEDYFLYFEEVDYCKKARRAGWPCSYVPTSRVVHLVGQSTGVTDTKAAPKRVPDYWFASRRRYFVKNHGRVYAALASMVWAGGYALWRVRRWLQRKPDNDPPQYLRDFLKHSFGRPAIGGST